MITYWVNYTYYPNHGEIETRDGVFITEKSMSSSEGIENMKKTIITNINAKHTGNNGKVRLLVINNFKWIEE